MRQFELVYMLICADCPDLNGPLLWFCWTNVSPTWRPVLAAQVEDSLEKEVKQVTYELEGDLKSFGKGFTVIEQVCVDCICLPQPDALLHSGHATARSLCFLDNTAKHPDKRL